MSSVTRGELYEQYKKSDPKLAERFLGENTGIGFGVGGAGLLGSSIITAIILISIIGSVTHGFGPTPLNPHFYSQMAAIGGGVCGPAALIGVIMLAIWHCKRRNNLAEPLPATKINGIARTMIVDSRPEKL